MTGGLRVNPKPTGGLIGEGITLRTQPSAAGDSWPQAYPSDFLDLGLLSLGV